MTASREKLPRAIARYLPSRDHSWLQMIIDVKLVNWRAGLPSMGWDQMFETPFWVRTYVIALPIAFQWMGIPSISVESGIWGSSMNVSNQVGPRPSEATILSLPFFCFSSQVGNAIQC